MEDNVEAVAVWQEEDSKEHWWWRCCCCEKESGGEGQTVERERNRKWGRKWWRRRRGCWCRWWWWGWWGWYRLLHRCRQCSLHWSLRWCREASQSAKSDQSSTLGRGQHNAGMDVVRELLQSIPKAQLSIASMVINASRRVLRCIVISAREGHRASRASGYHAATEASSKSAIDSSSSIRGSISNQVRPGGCHVGMRSCYPCYLRCISTRWSRSVPIWSMRMLCKVLVACIIQ